MSIIMLLRRSERGASQRLPWPCPPPAFGVPEALFPELPLVPFAFALVSPSALSAISASQLPHLLL